jgi:hypothetical protein
MSNVYALISDRNRSCGNDTPRVLDRLMSMLKPTSERITQFIGFGLPHRIKHILDDDLGSLMCLGMPIPIGDHGEKDF